MIRRRASRPGSRHRTERGAVTAELAMALPLLVSVTVGLVWLLSLGIAQARVVDAARETARALARGDDEAGALAVGRQVAPAGATVSVAYEGDRLVVTVTGRVAGPGGLFDVLPDARVHADAVAVVERGAGGP